MRASLRGAASGPLLNMALIVRGAARGVLSAGYRRVSFVVAEADP
jgi:hypothetical protein